MSLHLSFGRLGLVLAMALLPLLAAQAQSARRNIIVFVADGLRPGSVTERDAPTLSQVRDRGVSFSNSHSIFPTFTAPNASAIATGHYLGDTGQFGNSLYTDYRLFNSGNFGRLAGNSTPFVENDPVLGDIDDHFEGNYLGEGSLLAAARVAGYSTAAIGKLGPVAIQDIGQLAPKDGKFATPDTLIIDDSTGSPEGVPMSAELLAALKKAGLPPATPIRVQPTGDQNVAGIRSPNWGQQVYFIEAATRVVLPLLKQRHRPFMLVYWSRDPDGTQHNQGDSLLKLNPGINGPTSRAAVKNADDNLRQLLDYLQADVELQANTDVFVTSDHGFATISKRDIDAAHRATSSFAASVNYPDVPTGFLPPGFLAVDLAQYMREPLFDPDVAIKDEHGNPSYQRIDPQGASPEHRHPVAGNAWIGGTGQPADHSDADVIVAVNGGSDLIYLPKADAAQVGSIVQFLAKQDYVGALFVDDRYGAVAGTLPLSSIALIGAAKLPPPAIVVSFKTFALATKEAATSDPLLNAVQIADTPLQQGQGMHGSLGRDNTFNFMAAIGPDFKRGYRDPAPASNADITPTLAKVLGLPLAARGSLSGRVLAEALGGNAPPASWDHCVSVSEPAADGRRTILEFQRLQGRLYLDQAAFRSAGSQDHAGCR